MAEGNHVNAGTIRQAVKRKHGALFAVLSAALVDDVGLVKGLSVGLRESFSSGQLLLDVTCLTLAIEPDALAVRIDRWA